jgi:para-aminobenzoate synthetase component 1
LFLSFDPATRELVTRPMKGTRPAGGAAALSESPKDRAELAMIVDLMRNDLGRVCRLGSVRVDEARVIERHGTGPSEIVQATATVRGEVPAGASAWDVLRGTFPGGSVTGAPKIRAMQIIDELEPVARGPYCGAMGFVSDSGHMAFNLAIRTALISGHGDVRGRIEGEVSYSVGAGIVADSRAEEEWEETLQKAAGFEHVLRLGRLS